MKSVNIVRTGVRSVWKRSWTFLGVKLQHFGSQRVIIYMVVRVINSNACYAYIMWTELGHSHCLYLPAVSNVVTTGNGTGTKNVLKWNRALGFEFSIQSSVFVATTVAKVNLFST